MAEETKRKPEVRSERPTEKSREEVERRELSRIESERDREIKEEISRDPVITPRSSSEPIIKSLSPTYIYNTDTSTADFGNVAFSPVGQPKTNLAPPSNFQPQPSSVKPRGLNCDENPNDPRCHDEVNVYKDLGFFQETEKDIFLPEERAKKKVTRKPISTMYEAGRDDSQLTVGKVVRAECKCKDGRVVLGYLDTRTGQKDCSPCQRASYSSPNPYKNYQTKAKPNFENKQVPLRKQIGVSHFGDVNMKGCQTGNANKSLERTNQMATLNKVVNVDTIDSIGGATVTTTENSHGLPISMYDGDPTNVYGI